MREINLAHIMSHLHSHAPISRAALAEQIGLNKATVSSLVQELINRNYVHEVGIDHSGVGRPAVLLELNPSAGCIISGEIGVDFISVIRTNFAAEVLWRHRERTTPGATQQEIIERMLSLFSEAAEDSEAGPCGNILGISLGVPGIVDWETGKLLFAPNLGWRDVALGDILRGHFEVPIFVDNEANLAALGEQYFGAAQGSNEVLYISAGIGLGGGIVRGSSIYRGKSGFAGEFGHMMLVLDGELCNCGSTGCWETVTSQQALFKAIRAAIAAGQPTQLREVAGIDGANLSIRAVIDAAYAGDEVALEAFSQIGRYLGIGMASLVNALDPDHIVFGGLMSAAADFVLPTLKAEMEQRTINWQARRTQVSVARHGLEACVMGGVATVYQRVLAQPNSVARP